MKPRSVNTSPSTTLIGWAVSTLVLVRWMREPVTVTVSSVCACPAADGSCANAGTAKLSVLAITTPRMARDSLPLLIRYCMAGLLADSIWRIAPLTHQPMQNRRWIVCDKSPHLHRYDGFVAHFAGSE